MPPHPYKFLDPFGLKDELIFFGREAATEELAKTVLRDRLTVLHAKSGAGKTSLLNAGLSPRFIREGRLPLYVHAYYQDEDPVMAIKRSIASAVHGPWPRLLHDLSLPDFLALVCACLSRDTCELVVMLDQFEQFFILWSLPKARSPFIKALSICYDDQSLPLRFIIALRGDYFSSLGEFRKVLPHLHVFQNEYWLDAMTQEEANEAILRPLAKLGVSVTYEHTLLETLLADLTHGQIELPLLQIICTRLYEARETDEMQITLKTYEALGRAEGVLSHYLNDVLAHLPGREKSLARSVLKELVRSDATKQPLSDKKLAVRVEAQRGELDDVLHRLVDLRLLHRDEKEGEVLYELAHEYLATEILKWVSPADQEFKQAEELLQRELTSWRVHHELIPKSRLEVLYIYRERFKGLDVEVWKCLISSALTLDFAVEDWVQTAGDLGEIALLQSLKGSSVEIRRRGIQILGKLGTLRAVEPLIAILQDEDHSVREQTVGALGEMRDPRAVEPLITALQDEDHWVRGQVARVLGEMRDPRAVEPLLAALKDEDPWVQEQAAEALKLIGTPEAVSALENARKEGMGEV